MIETETGNNGSNGEYEHGSSANSTNSTGGGVVPKGKGKGVVVSQRG